MRKLTFIREAMGTYGSYATLKIFIQDFSGEAETTIKGVPCRLLGTIKSNESKTFEFDEREVKVFAVMSKAWRNYKYDYRVIPAGSEDVILQGKSSGDRRYGCLFYFDGITSPDVKEDFQKYKVRCRLSIVGASILICLVIYAIRYAILHLVL